jgi:clan AA aspartic protease (TIGR02281 family)
MLRAILLVLAALPAHAQTVSLQAQHHNMFRTDVTLNNRLRMPALVDTGASSLSMCASSARALGLTLGDNVQLSTANGVIPARRATIDSVRIGPIEVKSVAAVVKADGTSCDEVLIGMSVLRKLHVTLDGQKMTLVARRSDHKVSAWVEYVMLAIIMFVLLLTLVRGPRQRRDLTLRFTPERSFRKRATFF